MSNYWKKRLDELEQKTTTTKTTGAQTKSTDYWQNRMSELEKEEERKKQADNDIAPVKDKQGFFDKGHFEDGYQFGDLGKQTLDFITGEGAYKNDGLGAKTVEFGKNTIDFVTGEGAYKDNGLGAKLGKVILGIDEDTASLKDLTIGSAKRGFYTSRLGEESYNEMQGFKNNKDRIERELSSEEYQFTPGNKLASGVSGAFEFLGQQYRQYTNPQTLAIAGSAAGMAAIAGQAGPQVALPEEVISVPAAASAAFMAGSAKSSFEVEAGLAYNEMLEVGISQETAKKVALGVGAVNAGLEMLQVDELLDAYKVTKATGVTDSVAKKIGKELLARGIDIAKETAQEVAQEGVTIHGVQMASKIDTGEKAYTAKEAWERVGDTAVSSALSFGMMNVPAAAKNTYSIAQEQKNQKNTTEKLTENEQKVVDKVFEDIVAEREKDGTKLTDKEKSKIYDSVISDMDKGYINTDTIEEVLGGETYKSYKDTIDNEDALKSEFDTLNKMKQGEMTGEQIDRRAELKEILADLKENSQRDSLKSKLGEEVFGLAQGSRLEESYREGARRTQLFEADVSKYKNENAKQTVQNAIDSGLMYNGNDAHEFVDFAVKVAEETGYVIDFTTTERIAESIKNGNPNNLEVDAERINEFVNKNTKKIYVNLDAGKSLNSLVGHAITDTARNTKHFAALQKAAFAYAETKGELDSRRTSVESRYSGVNADIDGELTSDIVGDYLFTEYDFVKDLAVNHQNVFQYVWNEIKHLYKLATAGSREARQLETLKHNFEKAYREIGAKNTTDSNTLYSIRSTEDGTKYVKLDGNIFLKEDGTEMSPREAYNALVGHKITLEDGDVITFVKNLPGIDMYKELFRKLPGYEEGIDVKAISESLNRNIVEVVSASEAQTRNEPQKHPHVGIKDFDQREVFVTDGSEAYRLELCIANLTDNNKIAYVKRYIEKAEQSIADKIKKAETAGQTRLKQPFDGSDQVNTGASNDILPQNSEKSSGNDENLLSLSENNEQTKVYGDWNIFGDDIRYKGDNETVSKMETIEDEAITEAETPTENIAPTISETVAPKKRKPSRATLSRFTKKQTYSGGANLQGAYNADGKQYMSDGIFAAEFNAVDEKIPHNKDFPINKLKQIIDNAVDGQSTEKYGVDLDEIIELNKANKGNKDSKVIVSIGGTPYDAKYIEAIMRAIPDATFALSKHHGVNMLVAVGENGTATLMPLRAGDNLKVAYEAKQIKVAPESFAPTTEAEANAMSSEILDSLTDADAPPEIDAPYYGESDNATPSNPFAKRDYTKVGNPKTKSYISENPDALPYFQEAATAMLGDLQNSQKGEKWYNDRLYYESGGQEGIGGTKRETTADIADLLDGQYHYTYQQIENALNAIINNEPLNACAKRIEFALNDRLLNGYTDIDGNEIPANQDYINMLSRQQTQEVYQNNASSEVFTDADAPYVEAPQIENPAPMPEAPIEEPTPIEAPTTEDIEDEHIADIRRSDPKSKEGGWWSRTKKTANDAITLFGDKGWAIENLAKKTGNRELEAKNDIMKNRTKGMAQEYIKDNLLPIYERIRDGGKLDDFDRYSRHLLNIDRMSLDTEEAKARRAELKATLEGYDEKQIERMASETITRNTPEERAALIFAAREYVDLGGAKGKNKAVFGNSVTAEKSRIAAAKYEAENPEFKEYEQAVLEYNRTLREMAVEAGLISQKTADLWAKMYPHYVPIRRTDKQGASISVPLDTNKTGVNNPFKRATGGNSDFEPLFETMAANTEQIIRAINRNRFGVELMETLQAANILDAEKAVDAKTRQAINAGKLPVGTKVRAHDRENIGVIESFDANSGKYSVYFKNQQGHHASVKLDGNILSPIGLWNSSMVDGAEVDAHEVLESIDENDNAVLKEGKNGVSPSFTVFQNGKRVEFDITEEIYNALKPTNEFLAKTNKPVNAMASGYKKLVTQLNPMFSFWRNPIKDTKDVLFNSQHAAKTYATAPETIKEFATKGKYFEEFRKNGGMSGSYYDTETKTFKKEPSIAKKVVGFPLKAYENVGEKIEMFWRLSEYIASRKEGRSVEVSMLDAMRVTTNFAAGGDVTKFLNRNGALFLNPSVQGAMQAVRNAREAAWGFTHKDIKGGLKATGILAAKVISVGLGGMLFNWLLWDDDEDYEELSDYTKQNYFMIAKTEDGKFIRIPKGRMETIIQNGFEQMQNLITGDDDVDMETFGELVMNNLAPNNPLENNLIAPILQAKNNKTWYGEDLVPTRLQDLPAAEQYDESTDAFSKWLGEKLDISPYKINYVLDQYSGGVGDVVLPMLTPEAESGDNTLAGNLIAPFKKELTVDPVMKNQNVTDFYTTVDELAKKANSINATDEDVLAYKYMSSINSDLSKLYQRKREIQNSGLSADRKYKAVYRIQEQINALTKQSLNTYGNVRIDGDYAKVGDRHYRLNDDGVWVKLTDKQIDTQEDVVNGLGISEAEYWSNKSEYDFAYEYPEKYAVAKSIGGYEAYKTYSSELYDIKADKDSSGKSITGSRKEKVIEYVNGLDIDYGARLIIFKSEYNADDTYNYEIIEYLNSRDDISYEEMETILKELGFKVDSKGNITWD